MSGIISGNGISTHQVNVQGAEKLAVLLTHPTGTITTKLISPTGNEYTSTSIKTIGDGGNEKIEVANPEEGTWTIQVESAGNGEGIMERYRLEAHVNLKPSAQLIVSPQTTYTYQNITFDASNSHDNDLNGYITKYYFDYGDTTNSGWITTNSINHEYTDNGVYYAKVKVMDDQLAESSWSTSIPITVINRAPVIESSSPLTNPTITEELSQIFTVTASDPDKDSITIRWYLNNSLITTGWSYTFIANYTSAGWYNVKVVVSDGELSAEHSWILTVTNVDRYPIIDSYSPLTNPMITEEETQVFTVSASDPDYDQLTISWYLNGSLVTTGDSYTFVADYNSAGWYEVKVVVSDGELSVNHIWILSVADVNRVPIVISITANPTTVNTGGTATITVDASDEDTGDVLTYVYSCTGGTISGTGNTVTWTAPNTAGDYTITVYVNDGMVNSNSKSVDVTVTSAVADTDGDGVPDDKDAKKEKGFIPGFEATYIIMMLGVCVLLLKRRKK